MNNKIRVYHSGGSDDLETVIERCIAQSDYQEIALIGFSLGGNITLKYLGERNKDIHPNIKSAVAISVPCDLKSSAERLAEPTNALYMKRFLKLLHQKIRSKMKMMPGKMDDQGFHQIKTFREFDDRYTAPLNGYRDAEEYWRLNSSREFIPKITIPTLLINARNDPFLAPPCFPEEEAKTNPNFFLEIPDSGGHVGFISFNRSGVYWSENRALGFINEKT